jgi:RNA polymerase sigma factor (sigma-70 family)
MDDSSLLKVFAQTGDERAFREVVNRHIDLVYAAARRQVRDAHLAEDVSQAVFTVLARKAASIRSDVVLPAWLITTTRYISRDALRAQRRRQIHENDARQNMSASVEAESGSFEEMSPLLDDALARLRESDRVVITLRYLKGLPTTAVAAALGISTAAAEKRILRAIAKMRDSFARRGVVLSAVAVSTTLLKSPDRAPAGVATRVADAALAARSALPPIKPWRAKLMRSPWIGFAAATVSLLLASAFIVASITHNFGTSHSTANVQRPPAQANGQSIKVGVLLSEFTTTGWHTTDTTGGYNLEGHQSIYFHLKRLPQLKIYTIVEPGQNPELEKQLPGVTKYGWLIDGSDVKSLSQLDVIVAGHSWHMRPEVLNAIDQAVQGGVGFLHQTGFAVLTPSFNDQVCSLVGLKHAEFFYHPPKATARVVADHPLLKGLKIGDVVHGEMFYGAIGPIEGTPLIAGFGMTNEVRSEAELTTFIGKKLNRSTTRPSSADSFDAGPVFCPLYVSQHGKGRVVACQWHNAPPDELDPKHDETFYLHCIEWLAGRAVE